MVSYVVAKNIVLRQKNFILFLSFIVIFLCLILNIPFAKKIYPNIYVSNIYLGDKTKEEALNVFKEKYKIPEKVVLKINDTKKEISSENMVLENNYQATIDRAYNYTNTGNYITDFLTKVDLIFRPVNLYPIVKIDENKLLETLLILTKEFGEKPVYPSAKIVNNKIVINSGKNGSQIDADQAIYKIKRSLLISNNNEVNIELNETKTELNPKEVEFYKTKAGELVNKSIELKFEKETIILSDKDLVSFLTSTGFSDELIKTKILEISRELNRSPQNSVFIVEDGKVAEFSPSKDGVVVDETKLLELIKQLPDKIDIPVVKTSPKIKNEDVNSLGINTLLGVGKSNFKGSIPNRIHNVNLAQSKFKGILIPPDEIVSFNNILGDVSNLTGYKAAYVIKDGKTVLGDGGGVCQVSTTLFRAVLDAGLPIIERRAHAYRVGYYEQGFPPGLDATVYSPTTDFKFKNDTLAYLLIQPTIDLNNLSLKFEIYGTSDGRVSSVSKPVITSSVAPAEDLYVDDPTIPAGTIKQIEHKAYGAKVVFNYKVTRDGKEIINKIFISNYQPWQAVYLRGIGQ
jgi:vancomycin resistance protein YoaR